MDHRCDSDLRFVELVHDDIGVSLKSSDSERSSETSERFGKLGNEFYASLELMEEGAA